MSGTFEGTARGAPMLFIPFFADQHRNALKSVASGNALMLPFSDLTAEALSAALEEILTNKEYYDRAKEISRLFNDNLVHPMDEAIFWIEYVMRSKGAKHLKSHAAYMSWISYLLLDILIIPVIAIVIVYFAIKAAFRAIKPNTNKGSKKRKSQKIH